MTTQEWVWCATTVLSIYGLVIIAALKLAENWGWVEVGLTIFGGFLQYIKCLGGMTITVTWTHNDEDYHLELKQLFYYM